MISGDGTKGALLIEYSDGVVSAVLPGKVDDPGVRALSCLFGVHGMDGDTIYFLAFYRRMGTSDGLIDLGQFTDGTQMEALFAWEYVYRLLLLGIFSSHCVPAGAGEGMSKGTLISS